MLQGFVSAVVYYGQMLFLRKILKPGRTAFARKPGKAHSVRLGANCSAALGLIKDPDNL